MIRHRDTRARATVTANGSSLLDVMPKLEARADEVLGRGQWHQDGPVDLKPWTTRDGIGLDVVTTHYEATMTVVATDGQHTVDGL